MYEAMNLFKDSAVLISHFAVVITPLVRRQAVKSTLAALVLGKR